LISESTSPAHRPGLVRNALHLGLGQIVTTALTMWFSAAIARGLGASEFGLFYLLTSIANFAYVFVDWGHGPYVTREIARHPERSGELMGSVLVVRAATAIIVCALAVLLTWLLGSGLRTGLLAGLLILAWLPQYLGLTYSWAFRGRERMEYDALIQVVLKAGTLALALACLALGGHLPVLIPTFAVAGTLTFAVAVIIYRRLRFSPLQVSARTSRELIRDGASLLAIGLAIALQPYIDANLLFKLSPANVVGWYGAAWVIAGTLVAPAVILGATMYPRLSRVSAQPEEFSRTLRTGFRPLLLVAVLGAVGTFLYADFAVGIIYSRRNFGPAADILRAFTPALLLVYIDMLFGNAILAVGKASQLAKAKVVAVVVTTAAELVLIPFCQARFSNGGIGIVLAMASGELVMVTAAVLLIRHMLSGGMALDFLRGLTSGAGTIVLMRSLPAVSPLIGIPLCLVTFAVLSLVVGLVRRADLILLAPMFRKRAGP
jgi:O-antigen/teichoic acid export membrane protein